MGTRKNALQVTLPSDKEILLQRAFDAPRHLVFAAMTRPEHVRVWWACMEGFSMSVCEIDLRVGGRYRFVTRGPDGGEFGFTGVYREIEAPGRFVHTEIFEPFPDEETLCTITLEERDGKTLYTCHVLHRTAAGRAAHIASGMESGAAVAFDRLEALARSLAGHPRGARSAAARA